MARLDLTSDPPWMRQSVPPSQNPETPSGDSPDQKKRKFLGIRFNCCSIYVHIYPNKEGTAYEGRCPKCGKPVKLKIGSGGTDHRFFEVD